MPGTHSLSLRHPPNPSAHLQVIVQYSWSPGFIPPQYSLHTVGLRVGLVLGLTGLVVVGATDGLSVGRVVKGRGVDGDEVVVESVDVLSQHFEYFPSAFGQHASVFTGSPSVCAKHTGFSGFAQSAAHGIAVGEADGLLLGCIEGCVGKAVGTSVGVAVGLDVGVFVGNEVGNSVGLPLVGLCDGTGAFVFFVGKPVGAFVGPVGR